MTDKIKIVVWDADDVITPLSETFYNSVVKTHGACLHPDQWIDYQWGQHIGCDEGLETESYLIQHRILESAVPYSYTKQALQTTCEAGLRNVIVSARNWHPTPLESTQRWAVEHDLYLYLYKLYFVAVTESKRDTLERLCAQFDVVAFVDDNLHHVHSAPLTIGQTYLMERNWNKHATIEPHIQRIPTALVAAQHIVQRHERNVS